MKWTVMKNNINVCPLYPPSQKKKTYTEKKTPIHVKQIWQFTVPNKYLFDIRVTIYFVTLAIQFFKHFILTWPVLQALLLWSGIISWLKTNSEWRKVFLSHGIKNVTFKTQSQDVFTFVRNPWWIIALYLFYFLVYYMFLSFFLKWRVEYIAFLWG